MRNKKIWQRCPWYVNSGYCKKFWINRAGEYFVIYTLDPLASEAIYFSSYLKEYFSGQTLQVFISVLLSASSDVLSAPFLTGTGQGSKSLIISTYRRYSPLHNLNCSSVRQVYLSFPLHFSEKDGEYLGTCLFRNDFRYTLFYSTRNRFLDGKTMLISVNLIQSFIQIHF